MTLNGSWISLNTCLRVKSAAPFAGAVSKQSKVTGADHLELRYQVSITYLDWQTSCFAKMTNTTSVVLTLQAASLYRADDQPPLHIFVLKVQHQGNQKPGAGFLEQRFYE